MASPHRVGVLDPGCHALRWVSCHKGYGARGTFVELLHFIAYFLPPSTFSLCLLPSSSCGALYTTPPILFLLIIAALQHIVPSLRFLCSIGYWGVLAAHVRVICAVSWRENGGRLPHRFIQDRPKRLFLLAQTRHLLSQSCRSATMERERKLAEREVREVVADAESPLAQRHVRESLKKNKFALVLYAIALFTPAFFLISFYTAKAREIRTNFRDPYALPEGFDPVTGEFASQEVQSKGAHALPRSSSLFVGEEVGSYGPRTRKRSII
ncbi:hypothetical protein Q4I28_004606 [Leishmania naiffi]|uniref:Transmembrane protein n=1 Tax=Leishmania naiffi TaxID=5678 RepID=A0AAW3BP60_9TRYP